MSDEHMQAMARGEHAKRILEDELVQGALSTIKAQVRDLVFELPLEATDKRQFLVLMDKAREQFERVFTLLISGAEVSKYELDAEANTQARLDAIREKARYATR
jgi:hypothetical protein